MQIIRLIYASKARPNLGYEQLSAIMSTAVEHNAAQGISGLLCYGNGSFLQAIEGRRNRVNMLYNRIVQDQRHSDCELLSVTPIEVRSFIEWSMKKISFDETFAPMRRALVLRHSGMDSFEPWTMTGEQAHGFLRELAELERQKDLKQLAHL